MNKKLVAGLVILALVIAAGVTYWLNPDFLQGNALGMSKKGAVEKVINKEVKKEVKKTLKVKKPIKAKKVPKEKHNPEVPASEIPTI